jgi:uncharacterized phage protein (TIGR01671 family)
MKRPIKFRAWSCIDKAFHYWDVYQDYPDGIYGGLSEPEQFVGIKDKNDKDIYEGDIVGMNDSIHKEETYIEGVITYEVPEFVIRDEDGDYVLHHASTVLETKGNIHENPELLK